MPRKTRILIALLVAAAVGATAFFGVRALKPKPADDLTLYGNVDIRQVSLAFDNSDRIVRMLVEEGDRVQPGQVLAILDTRALALQADQVRADVTVREEALRRLRNGSRPEEIAQAKARVDSAQASLRLAQLQWDRLNGIASDTAKQGVSQDDLDVAAFRLSAARAQRNDASEALRLARLGPRKEDIDEAQAQLESEKAQLALLTYKISQGELKAPSAGVIRARLLEPGDMASPQRPVYALALSDPKWIRAYATTIQLGHLHQGQSAQVYVDSQPGQPVAGRVGFISSVAEFTPKPVQTEELRTSLVFEVRILVDDPQDRLRMGMPATVRIAGANR